MQDPGPFFGSYDEYTMPLKTRRCYKGSVLRPKADFVGGFSRKARDSHCATCSLLIIAVRSLEVWQAQAQVSISQLLGQACFSYSILVTHPWSSYLLSWIPAECGDCQHHKQGLPCATIDTGGRSTWEVLDHVHKVKVDQQPHTPLGSTK